ncbi:MAG: hypothetical protein AMS14_04825 [Planctomycetes bacterium DG_20]|nr:MAG: hypothetical protein AMS14_04825 [Planctomycetes bacterium DG_20]
MKTRQLVEMVMMLALLAGATGAAEPKASSRPAATTREAADRERRRTPLVGMFEDCKDSVVNVSITRTEVQPAKQPASKPAKPVHVTKVQWGSGFVLHEAGYILTTSHALLLDGKRQVTFHDGESHAFGVVARDDSHDLALLKIDGKRPLKPLRLGQSGDLMVGERAVAIGNPFGMGLTMASGIISALGRATKTEFTMLTDMIQTDAGINPGNSGGPLLNILGEVVGVVTSQKREGNGIGFATPIDKVRAVLPEMIAAEDRYGFVLGMKVATGAGPAEVTAVAKGSPAEAAGVQVGDVVARVHRHRVRRGIDFYLALIDRKGGQALPMRLLRAGQAIELAVRLGKAKLRQAAEVSGLVGGLNYKAYRGRWKRLPDFSRLKPAGAGTTATFGLCGYEGKEHFGLEITGYVEVPKDGIYLFYTSSDDGSRLHIGDRLVVDNDGLHAAFEKRGFAALKAGKHPIRVTFFECAGEEALAVSYEGPGIKKQPIPAEALFRPSSPARRDGPTGKPPPTTRPKQAGRPSPAAIGETDR